MLSTLLTHLFAYTTMTMDDILYIAHKHDIHIDTSVEDKLTAYKNDAAVTFDVTTYNDGTVYIFDI